MDMGSHRSDYQTPRDPDGARLQILLLDYEMARDDERNTIVAQATLIGVAVTLIALLAGALTQVCDFGAPSDKCVEVPSLALGAAPLLPLGMLSYAQMIGIVATLRSYYARGLEAELSTYINGPLHALGDMPPISLMGLSVELVSLRRGRLGYRILANTILLAILLLFGGITLYIFVKVDNRLVEALMIIVYGATTVALLYETAAATVRGRQLFTSTARSFLEVANSRLPKITRDQPRDPPTVAGDDSSSAHERHSASPDSQRSSKERKRSLLSYLLLPRPEDLIKWTIAPISFVATAWSTGSWDDWPRFLALWLIFEYLVYESRYQWNDVRDVAADQVHAEHRSRARLPLGGGLDRQRRNIVISVVVGLIRLGVATLIGWALHLVTEVLILIGATYAIAIPYEMLRARNKANNPFAPTFSTVAIWLLVGLGYAIRAGLGFELAGLSIFTDTGIVGTIYFITFGIMFVLLTWVLDATSYCRTDITHTWYALPDLTRKPHLAALLHYVGIAPKSAMEAPEGSLPGEPVDPNDSRYCGNQKVLERATVTESFLAPWNWAMVISMGVGAAFGMNLAAPRESSPHLYAFAVIASVGGGILLVFSKRIAKKVLTLEFGAIILGATILGCLAILAAAKIPVLAVLPWLGTGLMYLNFLHSSYRRLKDAFSGIAGTVKAAPCAFLRLVVGRKTWGDLFDPKPRA